MLILYTLIGVIIYICFVFIFAKINFKGNVKKYLYNIRNSEIEIIENAGHEVNIDNPEKLSNLIERFWKISSNI